MKNFTQEFEIQTRVYPSEWIDQIKTGDFNGDGNIDFVVTRINFDFGTTPTALQIYLGDGNGRFHDATGSTFSNGIPQVNFVARMIVADFNSDNVSDLFCIDTGIDKQPFTGGQNRLFLSESGGLVDETLRLPQGLKNNHGASVADVNHDGYLDILVNALMSDGNDLEINVGGRYVSSPSMLPELTVVNPWSGSGTLPQTHTWSALIDINLDAHVDMILGHWDNPQSSKYSVIYPNDTNGSFLTNPLALPASGVDQECVLDIKPLDLNGDALPDLAISITNGGDSSVFYKTPYVQLLINDGGGKFHDETQARYAQTLTYKENKIGWYKSIDVKDVNNDGHSDMVLDGQSTLGSIVLLNDGYGNFKEVFSSNPQQRIAVGDVNEDGMSDLILSSSNPQGGFEIYFNRLENLHIYKANFGGDFLFGSEQADVFISNNGNDRFTGNGGLDCVEIRGKFADFTLSDHAKEWVVTDKTLALGEDTLVDISRIKFLDASVALDTGKAESAGQAYRLYKAAFDRTPDQEGVGYWINSFDHGADLTGVASSFIASPEFAAMYGANSTDTNFVTLLYNHVLHRDPDAEGNAYWLNALHDGMTRGAVLASFSESPENMAQTASLIANGIQYQEWVG